MGMSQEEIDRLMAEMNTSQAFSAKSGSQPEGKISAFHRIALHFSDAIRNIVPILVGVSSSTVEAGQPLTGQLGDLIQSKKDKVVFFSVKEPALSSTPFLGWMERQLAIQTARKMMGQEEEQELTDVLLSALNEAFSNILGALDTALKTEFRTEIAHSDFKLLEGDPVDAIMSETGLAPASQVCLVIVDIKMDDIVGAIGILCGMDALDRVYSAHPSSKQPEPATSPEKVMVGASGQIGKTTVPFETRPQPQDMQLARFEELTPQRTTIEPRGVELILDVPLSVTVELGRKRLSVKEVLDLVPGSLVELDKLAGENVDLYVNGKLFAKGEVVVIDENFGVRVSSIVTPKERLERLK